MNYLVHAFITPPGDDLFLAGHVLGDYFKGRPPEYFPTALQKAIWLHRAVDHFTDRHPLHAELRYSLSICGHYRAVLADMLADHILATDPIYFPNDGAYSSFVEKIRQAFKTLKLYVPPPKTAHYSMICKTGWLDAYRYSDQLIHLMDGLCRRIQRPELTETFYTSVIFAAQTNKHTVRKLIVETRDFVKDLLFKVS
jgi:acyl carrier protein phosphodiesterase